MARLSIKGLGDVGYIADQAAYELKPNAISELQNVRTRNGWLERVRGHRQISTDLSFPPYFLAPFAVGTTRYLAEAGLRTVQVDDGATRTDISPASALTMGQANKWTGATLNGLLALNNQADQPMYWDGVLANKLVTLTGWTSTWRAKALRAMRYHLVALGMTESGTYYPHRLRVSSAGLPGAVPASWNTADATVDADTLDVLGDGVLVDAILMGEALIIYKDLSLSAMRYSPSNVSAFNLAPLPFNFGMLSQNCGVSVPGVGHVVLTNGDIVRFDGNAVSSIGESRVREWLFAQMDTNFFANSFLVANPQKSEVWICFPESGQSVCTKALVWNYRSDTLSKRDLPNATCGCAAPLNYAVDTFDSDSATFNSESVLTFNSGSETIATNDARTFLGTSAKEVFLMDSSDTADGASFTSYVERTGLNEMDERGTLRGRVKHLKRLYLDVDAVAGTQLTVYFGGSNDAETAPVYGSGVTFTVGTDRWVDSWATGVYLAYKISSTGTSFWRVRCADPDVQDAGDY